jgi:UDP-N-acetylglucosamine--N-acetylmuramyl-(pentapeptide) pyrophosphoryl-undecaprenol N-acetylglucosamine transferase
MKIAIMAGGTGGHIFPGIAVANELIKHNVDVIWLGAIGGMEEKLVKQHDIPLFLLSIKGLRGKGIKGLLSMPIKLIKATYNARKIFKKEKVNAVLSMGGYVAGPGGLAAKLTGIPLVVHEQNSRFGMTNKYLSKWAKKTLTGFNLNQINNSEWIGNPVRADIEHSTASRHNKHEKINIFILGGSLGANSLNTRLPELLNPLLQSGKISVTHQCGKNNLEKTTQHYQTTNDVKVSEFIDDMSAIYHWADLIIARAGALTIAEINAVGIAAIFVPYPYAVDDHQTSNAQNIVDSQAGYIWQESQQISELNNYISELIENKTLRQQMAENSKELHKPNAAIKVAKICMELAA